MQGNKTTNIKGRLNVKKYEKKKKKLLKKSTINEHELRRQKLAIDITFIFLFF